MRTEKKRKEKRKTVIESDQTSLLINEEKNTGEAKYKIFPCRKNFKTIFVLNTNKQTTKKEITRSMFLGTAIVLSLFFIFVYYIICF